MATKAEDITPTTVADVVPESAKQEASAPVAAPAPVEQAAAAAAPAEAKDDGTTEAKAVEAEAEADKAPASAAETKVEEPTPVAAPATEEEKLTEGVAKLTTAEAAPQEPASTTTGPTWPELPDTHPLSQFYAAFEALVKEAGHDEVYGITLSTSSPFHTKLILQKFLRANQNDLGKAKQQLLDTLKWRKEFDPVKATEETFDKARFEGLGYIVEVKGVKGSENEKDIVTFNVYGAVKDNKKTFGDLDGFLRWRVALMERSVQQLNLASATKPIPNYNEGPDPYQGIQIHDYLQVSFLRRDPVVKKATDATIALLSRHYPETLSRKLFVNVPLVMGWLYQAIKLVVAKETAKKFTVLSYGKDVAAELGKGVPKEYGGDMGALAEVGQEVKLVETEEKKEEPKAEAKAEAKEEDKAENKDDKVEPKVEPKTEAKAEENKDDKAEPKTE